MHAFLIAGKEPQEKINELTKKLQAKPMEFPASKIEDIRVLNSFTSLSVTKPQVIILKNIENSTPEALSALLKNLEEPGENIYYILTCKNLSQVLPTIISRCEIIKISSRQLSVSDDSDFLKLKITEKFKLLEKIKDRGEALAFVKNLIISLHSNLPVNAKRIRLYQQVFNNLNANGNINIQLTYLAINQI